MIGLLLRTVLIVILLVDLTRARAHGEDAPIPIDVGRQLFVDDYLVADTTLTRTFHTARLSETNPVLKPETPIELNHGDLPVAAVFDDGVVFDPHDNLFKMWYHAGWFDGNCMATSKDGLHWERPSLDVTPGTNRVLPVRNKDGKLYVRDGTTVWLDHETKNPDERYKMFTYFRLRSGASLKGFEGEIFTSPDGVHWKYRAKVGFGGDNSSFFYDPFRKLWVYSVREWAPSLRRPERKKPGVRARAYLASADFVKGVDCKSHDPKFWLRADADDKPDPALGYEPELYDFTAVAYESVMLGAYGIFVGPPNKVCSKEKRPKIIDIELGFSRDGKTFERPDRRPFIASSRKVGAWDRGYLHPASGVCLIVGDELYFYFGAFSGVSPKLGGDIYAGGSTGLAILRRDGFASFDAAETEGSVTTKPVVFNGKNLFVNVVDPKGQLRVEVLDAAHHAVEPFTLDNCLPVAADSTIQAVAWKGAGDLSALSGKPVQFRFHLKGGKLYSFWVSPDASGASHGYVAAGGPGYTGATDTVGVKARNIGQRTPMRIEE